MKTFSLVIQACLVFVTSFSVSAAPPLPSIFGIQLGAPFDFPECPFTKGSRTYLFEKIKKVPGKCYGTGGGHPGHRLTAHENLWSHMGKDVPLDDKIVPGRGFGLEVIDGNVEGMQWRTKGDEAPYVLKRLVEKFGPPDSSGGSAEQITWSGKGVHVSFFNNIGRSDTGSVYVSTDKALAYHEAERMKEEARINARPRM
jgi:hypothetical protein